MKDHMKDPNNLKGMKEIPLGEIEGITVGHSENKEGGTGCTVALFGKGAVAGVDIRGGAPGTRETDLLKSENLVDRVHGILLSGGSAYGLDAAAGVMAYLEEQNIGFDVGVGKVPIVPAAVLFDLPLGNPNVRPDKAMGYDAAKNAGIEGGQKIGQGTVGAGTGATVGKILGMDFAMKGGIGTYAIEIGELKVGALVAVNGFGDVLEEGETLAGVYDRVNKAFLHTDQVMIQGAHQKPFNGNTTIGIVVTNGKFPKSAMNKIASMSHNGYARALYPSHTMVDGDTIFAASTGDVVSDPSLVGHLGAVVMERAIHRGIKAATGLHGVPAYQDLK